jgi:conjugative transfer region protein (TIGR03750 family)
MMAGRPRETPRDGLVTFLPHRLNRHPVVVRGLTADELWVCAGLSAAAGFVAGVPLAWLTHSIAMVPTLIVAGIGIGVFVGGGCCAGTSAAGPTPGCTASSSGSSRCAHPALAAHVGGAAAHHPLGLVDHAAPAPRPPRHSRCGCSTRGAGGARRQVDHEPIPQRGRTCRPT